MGNGGKNWIRLKFPLDSMKRWIFLLIGVVIVSFWWQFRSSDNGGGMKFVYSLTGKSETKATIAPGFEGGSGWLNTEAVGLKVDEELDLKYLVGDGVGGGKTKAMLVDFWTYSCINCQRTIPYLKSWWEKYKDQGLVIVGVHTPEFEFEKDRENVRKAMDKYGVAWPVVQDNDYKIWEAYKNRYWPRKYLINASGVIVYDHIGEGAYEETEREIQALLGAEDMAVTEESNGGAGVWGSRLTPELYINSRGQASGHLGKGRDRVELQGEWVVRADFASAGKGASLKLLFRAGEVNLVMSLEGVDEKEVGVVVDSEENKLVKVVEDDLYKLWQGKLGQHELVMEFEEGIRVHAFTFGK